ncbi:MAG: hypothetical protein ACR2NU_04860, partial [Aeoliella sp.]
VPALRETRVQLRLSRLLPEMPTLPVRTTSPRSHVRSKRVLRPWLRRLLHGGQRGDHAKSRHTGVGARAESG